MAFDGSEGGPISLQDASAWTAEYRRLNPNQTLAHYFGREIIEDILAQSGCVGIRIYYAIDANNKKQLVLVGVKSDEDDMVNGIVADISYPCPTSCAKTNALNS